MNPPPITACLGIDQATHSGWAIAIGRKVVAHGVVKNPLAGNGLEVFAAHAAVVARALELAGAPEQLLVAREEHGGMPLDRLTNHDRETSRKGRPGAPERSTKSIIGLGKPHGYWQAALDAQGHPRRLRVDVEPTVWRRRVHGVVSGAVKQAAIDWASRELREVIADHNEAEAICLARFASVDGVMMLGRVRTNARLYARGKREERRQLELGAVGGKEVAR